MFTKRSDTLPKLHKRAALLAPALLAFAVTALAQSRTFTLDADFDAGLLDHVNHSAVHDQLQLDTTDNTSSFLWIANSSRGTMARVDASTGAVLGEYRTAPLGRLRNPSRTAIDALGNVWTANRSENTSGRGSVVKIGLVLGGTRVARQADGTVVANPQGGYLAPPFLLCAAVDRDHDGLIRTSRGLGHVLAWADVTDGEGGMDGIVQDADDECILVYQRTTVPNATHVSLDATGKLWVGAYPSAMFDVLDGTTGAIEQSLPLGTGGFGGLVDAHGILWSSHPSQGRLLRYDTMTGAVATIAVLQSSGLTCDPSGSLWNSMGTNNTFTKIAADGTRFPGFPVPSFGGGAMGIAVGADGDVWIAHTGTNAVSRLGPTGGLRKRISIAGSPNGLCRDAAGKFWVTSQSQNAALRIDPNAGSDGLGAVDLTVPMGSGAGPQSFGDMATQVTVQVAAPLGRWSVVHDGGAAHVVWTSVGWQGHEPDASALAVEARAADAADALGALAWMPVANSAAVTDLEGRFCELRVAFVRGASASASPVLEQITIAGNVPVLNQAPDCSNARPEVERLWPPDGRMVEIPILGVVDPDGDPLTITITGITQDEPVAHRFGRAIQPDGDGLGTPTARVRAERRGSDNGRVYAIHFEASDGQGGVCDGEVRVCVPHDQGRGSVCQDDGQKYDSTLSDPAAKSLAAWPQPNPFNPSTTLHYVLPQPQRVYVAVYDVRGTLVRVLADEQQAPGAHAVPWDGRDASGNPLASGVYMYRVLADELEAHGRIVMVK